MERKIAATKVRTHFGEILKEVTEKGDRIIVERLGIPLAVIMSVEEFNHLRTKGEAKTWEGQLQRIMALRKKIKGAIPDVAELIAKSRQERERTIINSMR